MRLRPNLSESRAVTYVWDAKILHKIVTIDPDACDEANWRCDVRYGMVDRCLKASPTLA